MEVGKKSGVPSRLFYPRPSIIGDQRIAFFTLRNLILYKGTTVRFLHLLPSTFSVEFEASADPGCIFLRPPDDDMSKWAYKQVPHSRPQKITICRVQGGFAWGQAPLSPESCDQSET